MRYSQIEREEKVGYYYEVVDIRRILNLIVFANDILYFRDRVAN